LLEFAKRNTWFETKRFFSNTKIVKLFDVTRGTLKNSIDDDLDKRAPSQFIPEHAAEVFCYDIDHEETNHGCAQ